jgi:trehalose 6-phosphate phosphatase
VAVVSGRPARFLQDALAIDGLAYVGTYGLERIVDGAVVLDDRVRPYVDAIGRAADEAETALAGLRVERKGDLAVTVHWREQPERGDEANRWAAEAAHRLGLEAPLRGRMAVELRPPVPVDKGTTVAELARGMRAAAFAGDDAGDLPAFAALHALVDDGELAHALSIGVISEESPPEVHAADLVVEGPSGLAALLGALADAISAPG